MRRCFVKKQQLITLFFTVVFANNRLKQTFSANNTQNRPLCYKYQNVSANDLFVTIGVGFNSSDMYYAFKGQWGGDGRWSFNDYLELAILQF